MVNIFAFTVMPTREDINRSEVHQYITYLIKSDNEATTGIYM